MGAPTSATVAAQFLERYGDLLGLLALLPLLAHLKFGLLLDGRDKVASMMKARKAEAGDAAEADAKKDDDADSKEADAESATAASRLALAKAKMLECVPPTSALVLLLLAEFCFATQLFDPSEKIVRKAMGDILRSQDKDQTGVHGLISSLEKLIAQKEVYTLARFLAAAGGLGAMIANTSMRLHEIDLADAFRLGGLTGMRQSILRVFKAFFKPRVWLAAALVLSFVCGNYTAVGKFLKRQMVIKLLHACGGLFRALAAAIAIQRCLIDGPMPIWCTVQAVTAFARGAQVFVYERVALSELLQANGEASAAVVTVRAAVAMEAWCVLMAVPVVLKRPRMTLAFLLMLAPCLIALDTAAGGQLTGNALHQYLEPAVEKLAMTVAVTCLMMVFMGGFLTMLFCLVTMQVLSKIHKLDGMKY